MQIVVKNITNYFSFLVLHWIVRCKYGKDNGDIFNDIKKKRKKYPSMMAKNTRPNEHAV